MKQAYSILQYCFLALLLPVTLMAQPSKQATSNFARDKILAWCIVPFDSKNRGPEERCTMLNGLGITKVAYDWREKHIPVFDEELDAMKRHNIHLEAFWLLSGPDPANDKNVQGVFDFLKRRKVKTQVWYMFNHPKGFDTLSQDKKMEMAVASVKYVAQRANEIGCTLGLYNHEGWYGEPENQLEILRRLNRKNIGLVYNFNHAQNHIERFPEFFPRILPHLIALNLAGLKKGDQNIYPLGKGDSEKEMIDVVLKSGFKGPIGIINEDTDPDAEVGLKMNMEGLKNILQELGDTADASSYL